MALQKGDKAPFFKLFSHDKKEVALDDFKGQAVVLHFFPLAFTGTCTKQLCNLRDEFEFYRGLSVNVLGVSNDSPQVLNRFRSELNLPFDLLSDYNRETSKAYGACYDEFILKMRDVAKRAAFIIDGNGTIQYAQVLEDAGQLPDFVAMKEVLKSL